MSGKLWMFSDQLDDEDLEFARHSFSAIRKASLTTDLRKRPSRESPGRQMPSTRLTARWFLSGGIFLKRTSETSKE